MKRMKLDGWRRRTQELPGDHDGVGGHDDPVLDVGGKPLLPPGRGSAHRAPHGHQGGHLDGCVYM
jgi:hypothetical protein